MIYYVILRRKKDIVLLHFKIIIF